jgi:hypothetical protein
MNTGSARTAPPSSTATDKPQPRNMTDKPRSTTDKPQPTQSSPQAGRANENTQEFKGSESRGHSQHHNGNNYYGDNLSPARQSFSATKSFDDSITHNGNNIGLKDPNDYDTPPPQQSFQ